jgi:formylglycine-generating enzyme required for sulfatase activity
MINQIEDADFVLVVCTENYERRFRGKDESGKGMGAQWEGAIITQVLYDSAPRNTVFIPVLFSPDHSASIPIPLRGATYYNLNAEGGYEALYRRLTDQPLIQKPELGKVRPMPPLPRKQPTHEKLSSDSRTGTRQEDTERVSDGKGDAPLAHTPGTAQQPHGASRRARQPFEPEMILIPAGEFLMGSDARQDASAYDQEQPQHLLYLPDYYLAKTAVTNVQYYEVFAKATGYHQPEQWTLPRGKEDHPVVHVSWSDALTYCRWLSRMTGKAYGLPGEAEWEKGARGTDGRVYPWGNQWDATYCNSGESGKGETTPVGTYPQGASPYGLLDMAGNVWEWTRSLWGAYPYPSDAKERARREDLDAPQHQGRVRRGGAFDVNQRLVW